MRGCWKTDSKGCPPANPTTSPVCFVLLLFLCGAALEQNSSAWPDPPSQIQAPCRTLPLLPKETKALLRHSCPHTETEHYPAVHALLHMTQQRGRRGLRQTHAPCCVRLDLKKPPGKEGDLEVWGVGESWAWRMMVPQVQKAFQHEQRHRRALWDSCHTAACHYTLWIYRSLGGTVVLFLCGNTDIPLPLHIYWDLPIPRSVSRPDMATLCICACVGCASCLCCYDNMDRRNLDGTDEVVSYRVLSCSGTAHSCYLASAVPHSESSL